MLDVIDRIGRVDVWPEIHHEIPVRIDQEETAGREPWRPLFIE
jgi:hypothetical protein